MGCKNVCKLCDRLIISQSVAFTDGQLIITLPSGSYENKEKYCIVVAQSIPATTTINAPVVIQIGTGSVLYPVTKPNCTQLTASGIRTRSAETTRAPTNPTISVFVFSFLAPLSISLLGIKSTGSITAPKLVT